MPPSKVINAPMKSHHRSPMKTSFLSIVRHCWLINSRQHLIRHCNGTSLS